MAFFDGLLVFLIGVQNLQKLLVNLGLTRKSVFDLVDVIDSVVEFNGLVDRLSLVSLTLPCKENENSSK